MLSEALTALAAAGGTAVVQAVGTEEWPEFRQRMASWLGRAGPPRANAALERLDQTADELESATELIRAREMRAWLVRIGALLESLEGTEQNRAAEELRALLAQHAPTVSTDPGPLPREWHVEGEIEIQVTNNFIHGAVTGVQNVSSKVGHTSPGPENDPDDDWPQES